MDFSKLVEPVIREHLNLIAKDIDGYIVWHQTNQKVFDLFYYDTQGNVSELPEKVHILIRKALELQSNLIFGDNKFIVLKHGLLHIEDKESFDTKRFYSDRAFRERFFLGCHLDPLAKFGYVRGVMAGLLASP